MSKLAWRGIRAGMAACCLNGHPMHRATRDVDAGESNTWGQAFEPFPDPVPPTGAPFPKCSACGAALVIQTYEFSTSDSSPLAVQWYDDVGLHRPKPREPTRAEMGLVVREFGKP